MFLNNLMYPRSFGTLRSPYSLMTLLCSSQSARDLQTMLNQDLDRLAQWLYEHKLTLNVSKSKFMLIGDPRKLNTLEAFTLTIKEKELD